jgi:hypothetical protein
MNGQRTMFGQKNDIISKLSKPSHFLITENPHNNKRSKIIQIHFPQILIA